MKIQYVIPIHLMRGLTNFYHFRLKKTATAGIAIRPTKAWLSQLVTFKNAIWTLEEQYAIRFCFKLGKNAMRWKLDLLLWPRDRVPSGSMLALPDPRRADRANPSTNFWWSLFWHHWHDLHALGSHWTDSQQGILCWGLRDFRKRFRRKRPALFKSGQWHFHQDNAPVHNSILVQTIWPRWASRQFLSLPKVQTLLPVTFAYSLSSEAVFMRQLRRSKRLWGRSLTRSYKRTSMWPSRSCWNGTTSALQPEETRVSCVHYQ